MNFKEAKNIIGHCLNNIDEALLDGLPGGRNEEWNYDEQLIIDIGLACQQWEQRQSALEQPWAVSFYNGDTNSWELLDAGLRKADAYRLWWAETHGATRSSNPADHNYYYMHLETEQLNGRHQPETEGDDFSVRYLLDKSFR